MRILWTLCFKMMKYTSRLNVVLVIVCFGGFLFLWNRCQIRQFESHANHEMSASNTPQYRDFENILLSKKENQKNHDNGEEELYENKEGLGKEMIEQIEENDKDLGDNSNDKSISYKNIDVVVNGETKIDGRIENNEIYIPFSFVRDYFEIEGKVILDDFGKKFHIRHTSYEYFIPKTDKYDTQGSFLWFVNYNVEGRSRVKCITGSDEVPISTQWGQQGYRYPIQIAQYGLSHFSMWVEKPKGHVKVIEDCEKTGSQEWIAKGKTTYMKYMYNDEKKSRVMEFNTNGRYSPLITRVILVKSNYKPVA